MSPQVLAGVRYHSGGIGHGFIGQSSDPSGDR
jgi:hypothetical protein